MLTDFQNSFIDRLSGKFATNSSLNIPLPFKYVATEPKSESQLMFDSFKKNKKVDDFSGTGVELYVSGLKRKLFM